MPFDKLNKRLEGLEDASLKGIPIRNLYRLMYLPEIWQEAYANIYSNKGAMTKGVSDDTLDGMSHQRIDRIITALKENTYRPKPVKRVYIPKRDGKKRPLGLPSGDDKLTGFVVKLILERIYEPIFSNPSHGFRPNRSCHTALEQVRKTWKGVKWFVATDISGFFNNVDHSILEKLLEKKIADKRFIKLINAMLKAGYIEDWTYHTTYSGTPQGGTASPILSNIFLHELDQYIETLINQFNVGKHRPPNPEYKRISQKRKCLRRQIDTVGHDPQLIEQFHALGRAMRELPSQDVHTEKFKRLKYCRYADDFRLGVTGSKQDALTIMHKVITFLSETLNLEISAKKSGITSAKEGTLFLNYHIQTWRTDKLVKTKVKGSYAKRRSVNGHVRLLVPEETVQKFCHKYGYGDWSQAVPKQRPALLNSSDVEIVQTYNAELRGLANYYCLADDVLTLLKKLEYLAHYSLTNTLASKHKTKMSTILNQLREGNELVYRYPFRGKVKEIKVYRLKHIETSPKLWEVDAIPNTLWLTASRNELVRRLNATECEYCGRDDLPREVHHVRKLKDLKNKPNRPFWQKVMIARNRKTIILCVECHDLLHAGKLPDSRFNSKSI